MRLFALVAVLASSACLPRCPAPEPVDEDPCNFSLCSLFDLTGRLRCEAIGDEGICVECVDDDECPLACVDFLCVSCLDDTDCDAEEECDGIGCAPRPECFVDGDCPLDEVCEEEECVDVPCDAAAVGDLACVVDGRLCTARGHCADADAVTGCPESSGQRDFGALLVLQARIALATDDAACAPGRARFITFAAGPGQDSVRTAAVAVRPAGTFGAAANTVRLSATLVSEPAFPYAVERGEAVVCLDGSGDGEDEGAALELRVIDAEGRESNAFCLVP